MPKITAKWEKIQAARRLLGLSEAASLEEVRQAYRRKAKQNHPDTSSPDDEQEPAIAMHLLTEAYRTIVDHCLAYRIPLEPEGSDQDDDEEWWMKRFGSDPLWGKIRD